MGSRPPIPASGKITSGITPNRLVTQTMAFIEKQLPTWRDDPTRNYVEGEDDLTGQLCKFLDDRARDEFPMAIFHHEEPQGLRRRVDISANPSSKAIKAAIYKSIYQPFLVIECKRLPAPEKEREREYLTGLDKKSGGIQRFRLSLHGRGMKTAMLIGYVQAGALEEWVATVNGWVEALTASGEDASCNWTIADRLVAAKSDLKNQVYRCSSSHKRMGTGPKIRLTHVWVRMPSRPGEMSSIPSRSQPNEIATSE